MNDIKKTLNQTLSSFQFKTEEVFNELYRYDYNPQGRKLRFLFVKSIFNFIKELKKLVYDSDLEELTRIFEEKISSFDEYLINIKDQINRLKLSEDISDALNLKTF